MKTQPPPLLVTGFTAFDGDTLNPSQHIAEALNGRIVAGRAVVGACLPTDFAKALPQLEALIERHQPMLVLALGQAAGRDGISLERVAINLIDARIADNAGAQPVDVAVVDGAPNAYFTTLPVKAMLARLRTQTTPANISHTAGTYVCNQVFFGLMHLLSTRYPGVRGGFVHVPCLPEQAARKPDVPHMSLESMIRAVECCLEVAMGAREDAHYPAGSTH